MEQCEMLKLCIHVVICLYICKLYVYVLSVKFTLSACV